MIELSTGEMDAFLQQINLNDGAGVELATIQLRRVGATSHVSTGKPLEETLTVQLYERALVRTYHEVTEGSMQLLERVEETPLGVSTGDPYVHLSNALHEVRRCGWRQTVKP